jgi:DNA-binding PadR family transcriptional regulator
MGAVSVRQEEGRKVYAITEEGRRFLAERGPRVEDIRERMHRWGGFGHGDEAANPLHALRDLGRDLGRAFGRGRTWDLDGERARRIGEVIARARHDIEAILTERPASPPPAASASGTSTDRPGAGSRGDMI